MIFCSRLPASVRSGGRQIITLGELPSHTGDAAGRQGGKVLEDGGSDVDVTILASLTSIRDRGCDGLAVVSDACSLAADALSVEGTSSQGSNPVAGGVVSTAGDLVAGSGFVKGHLAGFGRCKVLRVTESGDREKAERGDRVEHHYAGSFVWYIFRYSLVDFVEYVASVQTESSEACENLKMEEKGTKAKRSGSEGSEPLYLKEGGRRDSHGPAVTNKSVCTKTRHIFIP